MIDFEKEEIIKDITNEKDKYVFITDFRPYNGYLKMVNYTYEFKNSLYKILGKDFVNSVKSLTDINIFKDINLDDIHNEANNKMISIYF